MTAKASSAIQTAIRTSANSNMEKLTEKASTLGRTERCTTASGTKESSRATAFGKVSRTIHILVNGPPQKLTDTVYITGPMAIATKVSGRCALSMAKELIALPMEMFIQVPMLTVSRMVRASTYGLLVRSIPATFIVVKSMVKENGGAQETFRVAMCMKANTRTIVSTVKVSSHGRVATSTKVITSKMSAKVMVRCFGPTEVCMKESG